jgi:hypothetical protein
MPRSAAAPSLESLTHDHKTRIEAEPIAAKAATMVVLRPTHTRPDPKKWPGDSLD